MPYLQSPPTAPRGRPRDPAREGAILAVVLEVLAKVGWEGLSFEEVARRAHASKATLYRRWSTKRDMVVAAVKAGPAAPDAGVRIVTGSLRGDLLVLLDRLETSMRAGAPISLLLLRAGLDDPDLCARIEEAAGPTGARLPADVVAAAVGRGELPSDASPFAFEEVAGATLLLRILNGLTTDRAYRETLVDAVLIPALRAAVPASEGGIFSGSPTPAPEGPTP